MVENGSVAGVAVGALTVVTSAVLHEWQACSIMQKPTRSIDLRRVDKDIWQTGFYHTKAHGRRTRKTKKMAASIRDRRPYDSAGRTAAFSSGQDRSLEDRCAARG